MLLQMIDPSWTLFLDRDGVINERLVDDYVKVWDEFQWSHRAFDALRIFQQRFGRIVIVTNQQGIAKGLMTVEDLDKIHQKLLQTLDNQGLKIDKIYFCPDSKTTQSPNRKPAIGMALQAQRDFPEIDFTRSVMVGDSASDMDFGNRAGMKTVFVQTKPEDWQAAQRFQLDLTVASMWAFAALLA